MGYVRKLRDLGVQVWVMDADTNRVDFAEFRQRCAQEKITGVYFEGGSHVISELVRARQLDYLFTYRAPVLLADDKAKTMFAGLRPEKLDQAVRLTQVRNETFGDDSLTRGHVVYPEKLLLDENLSSLR
jgi:diaminohydroxyphosphoribosylaminopyrimidine deaminase/5-amino-6-(5-phosphoribosylamino)uracil reductase